VINIELSDQDGSYFLSLITDPMDRTELAVLLGIDQFRTIESTPAGATVRCIFDSPHDVSAVPPVPKRSPRELAKALLPAITALTPTDRSTGLIQLIAPVDTGATAPGTRAGALIGDSGNAVSETAVGPGRPDPREDPFLLRARKILDALLTGSAPYDLSPLVGLGIGFTPSGDDFVSGVLLVQQITGLALVKTTPIRTALGKTTTGGATLLRLALAGAPPEYLRRIIDFLLQGDREEAVSTARSHGHSSGLDALAGVLWAISSAGTII
jgi:hypothetical protein